MSAEEMPDLVGEDENVALRGTAMVPDHGDLASDSGEPVYAGKNLSGKADHEVGAVQGHGITDVDEEILGRGEFPRRGPLGDAHR